MAGATVRRKPLPTDEQLTRERQALELRRAGVTYDAIAERLGMSDRSTARKAVQRGLNRTLQEPAAELRALEADRLERLQVAVWAKAMAGDLFAVDRVLRIAERRSKLLGLDVTDTVMREIAQRRLELEEQVADQVAGYMRGVLAALGHDATDPAVLRVLAEQLPALAGGAA